MNEKQVSYSDWLPPVLLGVLSVIGICVVLAMGVRLSEQPVAPAPSETPFLFEYIGTEPGLSTLTPENTPTPIVLDTSTPKSLVPTSVPNTKSSNGASPTNTAISFVQNATATPTIALVLLKVDDSDYSLLYDGTWDNPTNVAGAYQETLHISLTVGNAVTFSFTGQQAIVSYQAGPSLGHISINLDGLVFDINQASDETKILNWQSQILVKATHTLRIEHLSGGSVNIDSITIPNLSTPTPTVTATPTQ